MNLDSLKVQTMPGSEKGSVYITIAENDGLRLGVRPIIEAYPKPFNEKIIMIVSVFVRVRVVENSPKGSVVTAKDSFGPFKFEEKKGGHVSSIYRVDLGPAPMQPDDARKIWKEKNIASKLSRFVYNRCNSSGATMLCNIDTLITWVDSVFDSECPVQPELNLSFEIEE